MPDTASFYDALYEQDPSYRGGFEDSPAGKLRFVKILQILNHVVPPERLKGFALLDVGCSTGEFMEFMKPRVARVAGADVAARAVEKAKARGFGDVHALDIEHGTLPFPDQSFDIVSCMEILEHIFSEEHCMREITRVLKPGGFLLVTVPNDVLKWSRRIKILFGGIPFEVALPHETTHLRFFSTRSITRTIEKHGFRTRFVGALPLSYHGRSLGVFGQLPVALAPNLFGSDYILIAERP